MTSTVRSPIRLIIPQEQWEPIGYNNRDEDPYIRLFGPPLNINGAFMHVMAIQVHVKDGLQQAAHPALEPLFDQMQAIYDGVYNTVTIYERQYVLLIHPYSD